MGPLSPPESVHISRRKVCSAKSLDLNGLAEKLSGPITNAVMNSLATLSITAETVQLLICAVERLLTSQPEVLDEQEPGASDPSAEHPAHVPKAPLHGLCVGDGPPSSSPCLPDPFSSSLSSNRPDRETRLQSVPSIVAPTSSPGQLNLSSLGHILVFGSMALPANLLGEQKQRESTPSPQSSAHVPTFHKRSLHDCDGPTLSYISDPFSSSLACNRPAVWGLVPSVVMSPASLV